MSTSYETIYKKFIHKLKGDTEIFQYTNMSESEISGMVEEHLLSLLDRSISKIYEFGKPQYDFYTNRDDVLQCFAEDLVPQEISLLANSMFVQYISETKNKLNKFSEIFKSNELNVLFSPSAERKSLLSMIDSEESKVNNAITSYLSRDRKTWNYLSIYSNGGNIL